ncbi:DEAD/DEAH box helicase family protein [Staphylococcus saprophyticus]|uniref:hypothetical protein n=1 Tax=Staphylococcus saprophyticus TaxID=29385 RepID=UPI0016434A29
MEGKEVGFVVGRRIVGDEQYERLIEGMEEFGIEVEVISRSRTRKEVKERKEGVK